MLYWYTSGGWIETEILKGETKMKKILEVPTAESLKDEAYGVIDSHTKQIVFRTTFANRNRARRYADKKDLEYGAVRFIPQFLA